MSTIEKEGRANSQRRDRGGEALRSIDEGLIGVRFTDLFGLFPGRTRPVERHFVEPESEHYDTEVFAQGKRLLLHDAKAPSYTLELVALDLSNETGRPLGANESIFLGRKLSEKLFPDHVLPIVFRIHEGTKLTAHSYHPTAEHGFVTSPHTLQTSWRAVDELFELMERAEPANPGRVLHAPLPLEIIE